MSGNQEHTNSKDRPSMSVEDMEKFIEQEAQYTAKGLQESIPFKDILDKHNAAFMAAKAVSIEKLSEDEREALEEEQEKAVRQFEREQDFARKRSFLQIGIQCKSDDPNSELFRTAKEQLDILDKCESEPSSISKYEHKKYKTGMFRYKELLKAEVRSSDTKSARKARDKVKKGIKRRERQEKQAKIPHSGYMSVTDLAKRFKVKKVDALRKRLDRLRAKNAFTPDLFVESQDRGANKPKFLYKVERVVDVVTKLKLKDKKRPTNVHQKKNKEN
jgi:hypothetical protein